MPVLRLRDKGDEEWVIVLMNRLCPSSLTAEDKTIFAFYLLVNVIELSSPAARVGGGDNRTTTIGSSSESLKKKFGRYEEIY